MFKTPTFGNTGLAGNTGLSSGGGIFGQNKSFGTGLSSFNSGTTGFAGSSLMGGTGGSGTSGLFSQQKNSGTGLGNNLFGNNTGTNVFQSPQQQQTQSGGGIFGQKTGMGLGSGLGTGLFNKPSGGSGLFGQQPQLGTQSSSFSGGTSSFTAGSNLFGNQGGSSGFGAVQAAPGTPVKFQPVGGTDTVNTKNGGYMSTSTITTAMHAISGMKEYGDKSFEELRFEDYQMNRRGPQQSSFSQTQGLGLGMGGLSSGFGLQQQQQQQNTLGGGMLGGAFNQQNKTGGLFPNQTGNLFTGGPTSGQTGLGLQSGFGTQSGSGLQLGSGLQQSGTGGFFGNKSGLSLGGGLSLGSGLGQGSGLQLGGAGGGNAFFNQAGTSGGLQLGASNSLQLGGNTTGGLGLAGMSGSNLLNANKQGTGLSLGLGMNQPSGLGLGSGLKLGGGLSSTTGGLGLGGTNTLGGLSSGLGLQANSGLGLGLGNNVAGTGMALVPQQELLKLQLQALKNSPFGDSPLFRNAVEEAKKTGATSGGGLEPAVTSSPVTRASVTPHYKLMPRPAVRIKPRRIVGGRSHLFEGEDDEEWDPSKTAKQDMLVPRKSVKTLVIKPKSTPDRNNSTLNSSEARQSTALSSGGFPAPSSSSNSVLTALITPKKSGQEGTGNETSTPIRSGNLFSETYSALDNTVGELHKGKSSGFTSAAGDESIISGANLSDAEPGTGKADPVTGITLTRSGYYTKPSLKDLQDLAREGDSNGPIEVDNFEVGRDGYGYVVFEGKTNVRGLNLDEIVHIKRKEICVYPDDVVKPSHGEGLNKKATVCLEKTWPVDKSTRDPITDPERLKTMRYSDKVERSTTKMGATFIDYKLESGSWIFRVDHFSKYGLVDDDSDEENAATKKRQKAGPTAGQQQEPPSLPPQSQPPLGPPLSELTPIESPTPQHEFSLALEDDDAIMKEGDSDRSSESFHTDFGDEEDDSAKGQSIKTASALKINPQHFQVMKASFFGDDDEDEEMLRQRPPLMSAAKSPAFIPWIKSTTSRQISSPTPWGSSLGGDLSSASPLVSITRSEVSRGGQVFPVVPSPHPFPTPAILTREKRVIMPVPWKESFLRKFHYHGNENGRLFLAKDPAAFKGRSFRVGWGPNGVLAHLGAPLAPKTNKTNLDMSFTIYAPKSAQHSSYYSVSLEKVTILPSNTPAVKDRFVSALEVASRHSQFHIDDDGVPVFAVNKGVQIIHDMNAAVQEMARKLPNDESLEQFESVCQLCVALWGRLERVHGDREDVHHNVEEGSYLHRMARRHAVADWLAVTGMKQIECAKEKNYLEMLCSLLSAEQVGRACQLAERQGDHRLAMIIAQVGGSAGTKALCLQLLGEWANSETDTFINVNYLKIYTLLSGRTTWDKSSLSNPRIETYTDMQWQRCLSLYLNFECSATDPISRGLNLYCEAFKSDSDSGLVPAPPHPPYVNNGRLLKFRDSEGLEGTVRDLSFHLLRLYANRLHRLERTLSPATYTSHLLDYGIGWFVGLMLRAVYYEQMPEYNYVALQTDFASQLESLGLWKWAIFVLLHLKDSNDRKQAVQHVLARQCSLDEDDNDDDNFLTENLRIPSEWIYEAKALRAKYDRTPDKEAEYCLKAGLWNAAHEVIMRKLASAYMISGNEDRLFKMLEPLSDSERNCDILTWHEGGEIIFEYLSVKREMMTLDEDDEELVERLQKKLNYVCERVEHLTCYSLEDRLCQSEISKKCASYLKTLLFLQEHPEEDVVLDDGSLPPLSLTPFIAGLPMPEDYSLSELKALTRSYLSGLVQ